MRAICPSCSTNYRVADEKIPASGARIKCPKCQLVFVVRPPSEPAATPPVPSAKGASLPHEQATPLQHLAGTGPEITAAPGAPPTLPPVPVIEAGSLPAAPPAAGRPAGSLGISAIRAQSGAAAPRFLLDSFRVRTAKGLTYDFSTREAMLRWLATREDRDECEFSEPGGDWQPVAGMMDLNPPVASTAELVALTPGEPLAPLAATPAVSGRVGAATIAAWIPWAATLFIWLAVLVALAATLTRYGIADFSWLPPLPAMGVHFPSTPQGPAVPDAAPLRPEEVYQQAMMQARQAMKAGRFSRAALEFNRALTARAGSIEALEGYATACERLGDLDRARSAREKIRSIREP